MSRKKETSSEFLINVGKIIKAHRLKQGLSQEELSFRSGIHATTLSDIECGKSNMTLLTCENIANALGVQEYMLFPVKDEHVEEEELSKVIAGLQKVYSNSSMKDKSRYLNILKCLNETFIS